MAVAATQSNKRNVAMLVSIAVALAVVVFCSIYLNQPVAKPVNDGPASAEAKAYLPNLGLSDVNMQATENFMNQRVVEIQGNISNHGTRKLALIDVYCFFYGVDGSQIHRERLSVIRSGSGVGPLAPGETRAFRLPFDELPAGWNQAMPHLVIAQIKFAE